MIDFIVGLLVGFFGFALVFFNKAKAEIRLAELKEEDERI